MKKLLFLLLLSPLLSTAQQPGPRFENDTLYTTCGYKIFKGQTLQFNKGLRREGRFQHVTVKNGFLEKTLTNSTVIVKEIKKYSTTILGNGYVDLKGYITLKDGKSEIIVLHMAFDRVIENSPVLPSELQVPDEFRNTRPRNIKTELLTLENLYQDKVISKAEYLAMEEKLIKQSTMYDL